MDLVGLLERSRRVVAFTGAGVSTESGIPDFRSPGGLWSRYDPRTFEFDRYVTDPAARALSWGMRREFFAVPFEPNPAHHALARLEAAGRRLPGAGGTLEQEQASVVADGQDAGDQIRPQSEPTKEMSIPTTRPV